MKIITALLASTILLSPAYAKKTAPIEPPKTKVEAPVCNKPEAFITSLPPRGFNLAKDMTGEEAFGIFKARVGVVVPTNPLPEQVDGVLAFKNEDGDKVLIVMFHKGCAIGITAIPDKLFAKLMEDGSV